MSASPATRPSTTSRNRARGRPTSQAAGRTTGPPIGASHHRRTHHRGDPTSHVRDVKVKPLEDRVLVTIDESEQTTASGLVIPDTAKEKPQQGTVIAVGPGKRSETTGDVIQLDVSEGDTVLFSKYGGTEVKVDGNEYLILSARDILAIIG